MQHNHYPPHLEQFDDLQKGASEVASTVSRNVVELGVQGYYAAISQTPPVVVQISPAREVVAHARDALLEGASPHTVRESIRTSAAVTSSNLNPERQEKYADAIFRKAKLEHAVATVKPSPSLSHTPRQTL